MLVLTAAEGLHAFVASCIFITVYLASCTITVKVNRLLPFIVGKLSLKMAQISLLILFFNYQIESMFKR